MHYTEEILKQLPFAVTICNLEAKIIYMNEKSAVTFVKYGGIDLVGKSLYDCHGPHAEEKIKELIETSGTNAYTIEKNGINKMIYQCPWYKDGEIAGLAELSLVIQKEMKHFVRKS